MSVFFFFFFFFLTCRVLLCLFGGKYHMQVWLTAQTLSVRVFELGRGMCLTLVSCRAQAPYEHRCAFMHLALNLVWNVSRVSGRGLITALWCLMCGSCCQCGVMCMCSIWMKTDFDFGMYSVCVLVAAAPFWHSTAGKLSHLNPPWRRGKKKEKHHFNSEARFPSCAANERPRQICHA